MALRDQTDDMLEGRLREVLREIIVQYVSTGEPISSRSLAKSGRFGLSPASLRNVMADLEDMGFLNQPHTSAGRVPTDLGYRFFINNLMKSRRLTQHEREFIDENVGKANELDEMMQLASRLLARLSNHVGVVFLPTVDHFAMGSIDFVPVGGRKILCVIVGMNGVVVNKFIETRTPLNRGELESIGKYLTAEFHGQPLDSIRKALVERMQEERARYDELLRKSLEVGIDAVEEAMPSDHDLFVEGTSSILNQPDFTDSDAMRRAFQALQEKEKLVEILNRCLSGEELQILIGSDTQFTRSYNLSIVVARCGSAASPLGLVGIIGPTRMEYGRVAPIVDYTGRALSRKIEESQEQS